MVLAYALRPRDAAVLAAERAYAQALKEEARDVARGSSTPSAPLRSSAGDARAGALIGRLLALTRDAAADLLVVGVQRHGASSEPLLGSVARTLWTRAPCAVALVPD
jgi:nucleotide-binding universal stress UspA family protein